MTAGHKRRSAWITRRIQSVALAVALGIACISMVGTHAGSQGTRTIKIVVPFTAGGGVDIVARLMADQIGRMQRATFVVENRPGAGTLIGTEAVARAAPDGNTILFMANSFIINPGLRKT